MTKLKNEEEILYRIDEKDMIIINEIQEDGRMRLKDLAKKTGLAVDTVRTRLDRLRREEIVHVGAFITPQKVGYRIVADINIELHNNTEEETNKFIAFLQHHPRVTTILSIMGDFDLTIVLVAYDTEDLEKLQRAIRDKFKSIIARWRGQIIMKTHKFEEYFLE